MTQSLDAERVLEHARHDERFETQLRGAYRGRHDVLDALWWAAHPLTEAPSGVGDPALELKQLQRAAFSRAAEQSQVRENEHRLREAQRLLAEDAQYLADALSSVEQDDESHEEPPPQNHESDSASPTRRKLLLPVLTGAILLSAILVLPSLVQLNAGTDPAPATAARPAERVQTDIVTLAAEGNVTDPLAILERAQTDADLPPEGFPVGDNRDSFRGLPDFAPHVQLYLASDTESHGVCLVVVRQDNSGMSGCTSAENFAESGVNVGGGNRYDVSDSITILTEQFTLLPDGEFQFQATARMTGEAAFPGIGSVAEPDLD